MSDLKAPFYLKYSGRTSSGDYKNKIITRMFPSIRYGRDTDLERYVMMRETKKPQKEWQMYYYNLEKKYTNTERIQLIRSLRKKRANFEFIFSSIIDQLYSRIVKKLEIKIAAISSLFSSNGKMLSISEISKMDSSILLKKIEYIINLFSPDKYEALDNINFLVDFAGNNDFKHNEISRIEELVKSYIDGSLFEHTGDEGEVYSFDMKEEYKKQYGKAPPKITESRKKDQKRKIKPFKIHIVLTNNDLKDILLKTKNINEYDICFTYLQKYMKHIENEDFATKIFVYSKNHRTNHFRIFDAIRKGVRLKHNKERIFDDIFKVVCNGRYIYNVSYEKSIDFKLKLLSSSAKRRKPVRKSRYIPSLPIKRKLQQRKTFLKPQHTAIKREEVKIEKPKAAAKVKAIKVKPLKQKRIKKVQKKERIIFRQDDYKTRSIENMMDDISKDKRTRRLFNDEFKKRLSKSITTAFYSNEITSVKLSRNTSNTIEQLKELIHYLLKNYDNILTRHDKTEIYKNEIEKFGLSIHTVYSIIIQCFTKLKTDHLTGNFKIKKGFFSRLIN